MPARTPGVRSTGERQGHATPLPSEGGATCERYSQAREGTGRRSWLVRSRRHCLGGFLAMSPRRCPRRHDWVVQRPDGSTARYVIDFYSGRIKPGSGIPVALHLDVRPAADSFEVGRSDPSNASRGVSREAFSVDTPRSLPRRNGPRAIDAPGGGCRLLGSPRWRLRPGFPVEERGLMLTVEDIS